MLLVHFLIFLLPLPPLLLTDVMYNGEMNEKIKFLYKLHIPPGKKFERIYLSFP